MYYVQKNEKEKRRWACVNGSTGIANYTKKSHYPEVEPLFGFYPLFFGGLANCMKKLAKRKMLETAQNLNFFCFTHCFF